MKFSSCSVRLPNATGASPAPQLTLNVTADEWELLKDAPCLQSSVLNVVDLASGNNVVITIEPTLTFHNAVRPELQKRRLNDCVRELRLLGFSKGLKDESLTALMTYADTWSVAETSQALSRAGRDDSNDFDYVPGPRNTRIRKGRR